jgi:hypothetical protein
MPTKIQGVIAYRKALRKFEPELAKETTKQITLFLRPVVRNARGFMPSNAEVPSGWLKRENAKGRWATRFYDASTARKGITYKSSPSKANRRGFRALASIFNKPVGDNVAGMIYETAGRNSGVTGRFTPKLGGELKGDKQKMTGRAIFRAFEEDQGKATAGVIKAIETSAAKFNARVKK